MSIVSFVGNGVCGELIILHLRGNALFICKPPINQGF